MEVELRMMIPRITDPYVLNPPYISVLMLGIVGSVITKDRAGVSNGTEEFTCY